MIGPDVRLDPTAWVHPSAQLYGAVEVGAEGSVWCNVVVRAESERVVIGPRTNIQDFTMIHIGGRTPTVVGADCSIIHHCTLHGCEIGDAVLVGIGSTIMDGCVVGSGSIIAGHTFLKEGTVIPPNSIVMGSPGEVRKARDNTAANRLNAFFYLRNAQAYAAGDHRLWSRPAWRDEVAAYMQRQNA